jgi:RHS repeat-associated protein
MTRFFCFAPHNGVRNSTVRFAMTAFLYAATFCGPLIPGYAATSYSYIILDVPGASFTFANGINNIGQVVGNFETSSGTSGSFLYNAGIYTILPNAPGSTNIIARGINDAGQIAGTAFNPTGNVGFLYTNGLFTIIDNPQSPNGTAVTGINNLGQMVGTSGAGGFLYTSGTFTILPLFNGMYVDPQAINNSSQITGILAGAYSFIFSGGQYTEFAVPVTPLTFAFGINISQQIVGYYNPGGAMNYGFIYAGGTFTGVSTPPATAPGYFAYGINDLGQIVGYFHNSTGDHGFISSPTGVLSNSLAQNLGSGMQFIDASGMSSSPVNPPNQGPKDNAGTSFHGTTTTGEPVNAGTGNEFETQVDFTGAANTGLSLTRYYNSQDSTKAPFGSGWHDAWHRGLINIHLNGTGSTVTAMRADGRQDVFTEDSSGIWTANANVTSHLVAVMNGSALAGWLLTLGDDTVEAYLPNGQLNTITTRAGLVTKLTYNSGGDLTTVTGPFGHAMSFTYDTSVVPHRVNQMNAPDGGVYAYTYDPHDNLAATTYPDGTTRQYVYQNTAFPNSLTGIIDEDGNRYATIAYDAQGRAVSTQFAGGAALSTIAYNADGSSTSTDANGNAHTLGFIKEFGTVELATLTGAPVPNVGGSAFAYDANGFLASRTDYDGNVTIYAHDALGDELSRTEAYGTPLARTYTATWLTNYHLPATITEPNGRMTSLAYDARGNLLTKTVAIGSKTRQWSWTYNSAGQVLTATDPNRKVTAYTYDTRGDIASVTDALGHKTQFTAYDNAGRLLNTIDPNGLVVKFTYDIRGRLVSRNVGGELTSCAYDAASNLVKLTRPDNSFYSYVYDAAHRLTHIFDALSDQLAYALDGNGNITNASALDSGGDLQQTRNFSFDSVNRLASEVGAKGQTTAYQYDAQGNLLTRIDPLNHAITYTYDALNRRQSFVDPLHNKTNYTYNANDDLTAIVDPRGLATVYAWDGLDDQTGVTSPDTGAAIRTFDAAGNLLTSTDARGKVATYTYDALNRPLKFTGTGDETISYTYDTGAYGIGHLSKVVEPAGTTSFTYNQFGQVLSKTQVTGAVTLTVTYTYDAVGRLSTLKYPSGKVITYGYDACGRVSALSTGAGSIAYFPFGPAKSWTEANGATYTRTFDKDARIVGIAEGSTTNVQSLTYDNASRITGLTETGLSGKTYGYDSDDRLIGFVNGTTTTSYTYDADSNRNSTITFAGTTAYHYPTTSNRLASLSGLTTRTESYDASGNQIGDGTITYSYDARGRMIAATVGGVTTSYAINAFGERIRKTGSSVSNGGANEYVYDEQGHLIGEYNSTGGIVNETVYLAATPVAVLTGSGGAIVSSVTADWLNAPHIIANSNKVNQWAWDHYAFGDNAPNQNPGGLGTFTYNFRFPGQYNDAETGLSYNMGRDYNPQLGRYVESDSLGIAAGINTYGYVSQNPLSGIDQFGLCDGSQYSIESDILNNRILRIIGDNPQVGWYLMEAGGGLLFGGGINALLAWAESAVLAEGTGTVWSSITATQEAYEGTVIPQSFTLSTEGADVWVAPNATEHLAEYALGNLGRGVSSDLVKIATQSQLTSLQAAVGSATSNGLSYGTLINEGGWELIFAPAREAGQLPALIHAFPY